MLGDIYFCKLVYLVELYLFIIIFYLQFLLHIYKILRCPIFKSTLNFSTVILDISFSVFSPTFWSNEKFFCFINFNFCHTQTSYNQTHKITFIYKRLSLQSCTKSVKCLSFIIQWHLNTCNNLLTCMQTEGAHLHITCRIWYHNSYN